MKKFLKDQVFNWAIGLILGFIGGGYAGYCWLVPRLLLSPANDDPSEDNSLGSVAEYLVCTFFGSGIGATVGALVGAILLQIIGACIRAEQRDKPSI